MSSAARPRRSPFRPDALSGKVALVTGGGSGIGFEITRQYGLHGARVVIMGRREGPLRAAVEALAKEGIEAYAVSGDVRNFDDCKRVVSAAVARFGRLDILVNNAAGNFLCAAEDLSPKGFKTVLEIDTMGVFNMCQAAFPELKKSGDALIINISVTLHYKATWYQIHPCAAKAAIDAMTRSLALEWGEYQIRANGIAPGPIGGTAGLTKLSGGAGDDLIASMVPIGRVGSTFDIAMSAVFLASDGGSYINGANIVVDGGNWFFEPPIAPRDMIREFARGVEKTSRETGIPTAEKAKL